MFLITYRNIDSKLLNISTCEMLSFSKIRINFSLISSLQSSGEEQKEMFIKDFLSQSSDEKLFRAMKKLSTYFRRNYMVQYV